MKLHYYYAVTQTLVQAMEQQHPERLPAFWQELLRQLELDFQHNSSLLQKSKKGDVAG